MKTIAGLLAAALAALPQPADAQSAKPEQSRPQAPPAAQACAACHGAQGEGNPAAGFPRIAGQSRYYIAKQLESYANGSRRNAVMEPIAKELTPEVRAAVAAYYARIDAPVKSASTEVGGAQTKRGYVLATVGDQQRGVQACINCHGPGGVGEPPALPYLAGLDANYITAALNAWKDGTRRNDAGEQMATVVNALTPGDIAAVAQYYASLPPPKPAPPDLVQAAVPQKKAAPGTAPSMTQAPAMPPAVGVGVEQGAPMSGGTQGEGGAGASSGTPTTGEPQGPGGSGATKTPRESAEPKEGAPAGSGAPDTGRPTSDNTPVTEGDSARGRAIIASGVHGCAACHVIPGIRSPRGVVGPPLGGMAQRGFIAGQLPNNADVLVAFLQNPPALVPDTGMPDVGLTAEEARHITAFLYTLEPSDTR